MAKQLNIGTVEKMARERGLKMTPQRRAIIEYLQNAREHPTTEEVFMAVNRDFPMTSRATVYNTVNWLRDAGMLQEIYEAGAVRLDPNFDRHHHFICNKCGRVEDIGFELISDLGICSLPESQTIESFEIVLRGTCKKCRTQAG
ncbi:MAG: Fur family transcriptional regulator [Pyrinomonadaceae bacterium]|jgi:Fur family peroxide stress response transcriptional regulator